MAASRPEFARLLLAALAAAGALALPVMARTAVNSGLPINLEAASSDFDYRNNTLLFRRVRITQGDMQVEAEEARADGLNFENSQWNLSGSVRIHMPEGRLNSGEADVTFRNNEILRAVIRGSPASFQQQIKDEQKLARGRASSIEYDVQAGTVRLTGDAWLTDGQNEIRGDTLVYDIGRQRVVANPTGRDPGGVRITINPRTGTTETTETNETNEAPKDPTP
jgi:lipopolysaccharide transport protein LptA